MYFFIDWTLVFPVYRNELMRAEEKRNQRGEQIVTVYKGGHLTC
jgi:hypothetical protein